MSPVAIQLEVAARHLPDPVLVVTREGVVVSANLAARMALLGTDAPLAGTWLRDLTAPDLDGFDAYLARCCRSLDPLPGSWTARTPEGSTLFRVDAHRLSAEDPLIVLRLRRKSDDHRFILLGQKLEDLNQEIIRRRTLQIELESSQKRLSQLYETLLRLQSLTSSLSVARTSDEIARVVVDRSIPAVGAAAGAIFSLSRDSMGIELMRQVGYSQSALDHLGTEVAIQRRTPGTDAVRERRAIFIPSPERCGELYPDLGAAGQSSAMAALPLVALDRCFGVVLFTFATPQTFDPSEQELMRTFVEQCAQALERARLFEAEQRARVEAEEERRRDAFLAESSAELVSTFDEDSALSRVARVAVPALGDYFAVLRILPDGTVTPWIAHHSDPALMERARALGADFPIRATSRLGLGTAVRGKRSMLVDLTQLALGADELGPAAALGVRSFVAAPLSIRGGTTGVLVCASAESGRVFGPRDLEMFEHLASRIALAMDNARLYREAREAERKKDEFLAMLGHELRNPLAPILTALELMRLKDPRAFSREREVISRQSRHLASLVDDLLDVSRIARGKIELALEHHDFAETVAQAIETTSPLLEDRAHRMTVTVPRGLLITADPKRLTQVVANLLNNAAKYTPRRGHITLSVEKTLDALCLRIRDDGMGISPEALPRLFEPFVQEARSVERSQGGLGLGLTIVKSLVELHGGTIQAVSAGRGLGSEFIVRLPTNLLAPEASAETLEYQRSSSWADVSRKRTDRVLVVDDNPDAAALISDLLHALGYEARSVFDGPRALELVQQFTPDVAILDLGLPVMDGYELATRLRAHAGTASLPLIALTGYGQAADRHRSRAAGFAAHLVKPVEAEMLRVVLSEVLAAPRWQDAPVPCKVE